MATTIVPELDHLKRAYAVTSKATQVTPLLESAALAQDDRCGARLRQAGIAAMGRLVQGPRRLLAAEAAVARRGEERRRRLFLRQFRARAGGRRRGARHSRHHRHADRRAGRQARRHRRIRRDASSSPTMASGRARRWRRRRRDRSPRRKGSTLLHPFDDPEIVAGQAGAGLEALDQLAAKGAKADLLFCAVGGGGLIGGVALAFHYLSPIDRDHRRRAGRLQQHGNLARAWRDRDDAARGQIRSATG